MAFISSRKIAPDKSALRNDQAYEFDVLELGEEYRDGMNKFECYDPKLGKYVPMKNTDEFNKNILWHAIGGCSIHLERATRVNENNEKVMFRPVEAPDIKPLRKYIADARALNLIADGKAPDLPENTVNQFMDVLLDFEGKEFFSADKGWNKELADAVKAELRGKKCVMQDFDAPHKLGTKVPDVLGENGLPVVKVLTDELIDELGPKVLREYFRK